MIASCILGGGEPSTADTHGGSDAAQGQDRDHRWSWRGDRRAVAASNRVSALTGTSIHVTCGQFDHMASIAGWHAHLGILAPRLEGRQPEGFWRSHTRLEAEYVKRLRV